MHSELVFEYNCKTHHNLIDNNNTCFYRVFCGHKMPPKMPAKPKIKPRIAANGYRLCDPFSAGQVLIDSNNKQWVL
ncbi:unnamed protein product, partial [Medioppia subpectinata]